MKNKIPIIGEIGREELVIDTKKDHNKYMRSLSKAFEAISFIEFYHKKYNWTRSDRRKFWLQFAKSEAFRKAHIDRIKEEFHLG